SLLDRAHLRRARAGRNHHSHRAGREPRAQSARDGPDLRPRRRAGRRSMRHWALGALALVSCVPSTEVIVYLGASPELRARAAGVHVTVVGGAGAEPYERDAGIAAGADPIVARVPIVPLGGDSMR